jgi:hypothetical protein
MVQISRGSYINDRKGKRGREENVLSPLDFLLRFTTLSPILLASPHSSPPLPHPHLLHELTLFRTQFPIFYVRIF